MSSKELKIHGFYIVIILGFSLIFQTVYDWSKIPNVPELISFAVGLTSLVLAIIAIVQNLIAGPNLVNSLKELSEAALGINSSTNTLINVSAEINNKLNIMERIPTDLGSMQDQLMKMAAPQADSSIKINEETINKPNTNIDPPCSPSLPTSSQSQGGDLSLYIVARSIGNSWAFKAAKLFNDDQSTGFYVTGYLTALYDTGTINFEGSAAEFEELAINGNFDAKEVVSSVVTSDNQFLIQRRKKVDEYIDNKGDLVKTRPGT